MGTAILLRMYGTFYRVQSKDFFLSFVSVSFSAHSLYDSRSSQLYVGLGIHEIEIRGITGNQLTKIYTVGRFC